MTPSRPNLDEWLRAHAGELLDAPEGPHVDDERLASLAERGEALRTAEVAHLGTCALCREVAAVVSEAAERPSTPALAAPRPPGWRALWPLLPLAAAAAVAVVLLVDRPATEEAWQTRGAGEAEGFAEPSLTFLAKGAKGWRVVRPGGRVPLGGRLGFRYGNPSGEAKTLSVLGWDGRRVHWYYPAKAGAGAFALEGGPDAVNRRLPDDIILDAPHRTGPLTLVAAFDVAPDALAAAARAGTLGEIEGAVVLKLTVERAP